MVMGYCVKCKDKREMKEAMRAGQDASIFQSKRHWLREEQREALAYRAAAKVEAQRQYEAEKLLREAA